MKHLRVFLLCVMVLGISLSCKTVTGTSDGDEESSLPQPTKIALPIPKPGGLITKVTLALGAEPETYNPIDPATEFLPTDTIHAVVTVKQAPEGTVFSARWMTTSLSLVGRDNEMIDSTEIETGGTGNLDFTLAPDGEFPTGTYRVEIYVNDTLDQLKTFKVIAKE
jgi:hypothetical protein